MKEQLGRNNNLLAVETAERDQSPDGKLFVCRISGCREESKTFGSGWTFLDHLKADHGYVEAKLKETGESQGCKVARHLQEVFGEEISLPSVEEFTKLVQNTSNPNSTVRLVLNYNLQKIQMLCSE